MLSFWDVCILYLNFTICSRQLVPLALTGFSNRCHTQLDIYLRPLIGLVFWVSYLQDGHQTVFEGRRYQILVGMTVGMAFPLYF